MVCGLMAEVNVFCSTQCTRKDAIENNFGGSDVSTH